MKRNDKSAKQTEQTEQAVPIEKGQEPERILVGLFDDTGEHADLISKLVQAGNEAQKLYLLFDAPSGAVDYRVTLVTDLNGRSFVLKGKVITISISFYQEHDIKPGLFEWVACMLAAGLTQAIIKQEGSGVYFFPKGYYKDANDVVWSSLAILLNRQPVAEVTAGIESVATALDIVKAAMQPLLTLWERTLELLTKRMEESGLPDITPLSLDQILRSVDLERWRDAEAIANLPESSWIEWLIDLLAASGLPEATKYLEEWIRTPDTDPGIVKYAMNALKGIDRTKPDPAHTGSFGVHSDAGVPVDALGFEQYAEAFAAIASDTETHTPFTVGIYARWGRGKTALLKFIERRLLKGTRLPGDDGTIKCVPIFINAWDLSRTDNVWAELYSRMIDETSRSLSRVERMLFKYRFLKRRSPLRFWWGVTLLILLGILTVALWDARYVIAAIAGKGGDAWETWTATANQAIDTVKIVATQVEPEETPASWFDWTWLKDSWSMLSAMVTFLTAIIGTAVKYSSAISSMVFKQYKKSDGKTPPGAQQASIDTIKHANDALKDTAGDRRFVIFVDDIDRCPPRKMLQVIETVQLFRSSQFFIFLAMDARVVRQAIGLQYKFVNTDREGKQGYPVANMGREYLEKVIQVPFNLPGLTSKQRLALNEQLIESYEPEEPEVEAAPTPPPPLDEADDESTQIDTAIEDAVPSDDMEDKVSPGPSGDLDFDGQETPEEVPPPEPESLEPPETTPVRSRLTVSEAEVIREILGIDDYDVSPRLWKRFINIYMLARHLYIQKQQGAFEAVSAPPASFTKWMALSVMLPYEADALIKWLDIKGVKNIFGAKERAFDSSGKFVLIEPSTGDSGRPIPKIDSPFDGLSPDQLSLFGKLLLTLDIDFDEVTKVKEITDCFNLVLD